MRNFLFAIVLSVNTFAMAAPLEKKMQIGYEVKTKNYIEEKKLEKREASESGDHDVDSNPSNNDSSNNDSINNDSSNNDSSNIDSNGGISYRHPNSDDLEAVKSFRGKRGVQYPEEDYFSDDPGNLPPDNYEGTRFQHEASERNINGFPYSFTPRKGIQYPEENYFSDDPYTPPFPSNDATGIEAGAASDEYEGNLPNTFKPRNSYPDLDYFDDRHLMTLLPPPGSYPLRRGRNGGWPAYNNPPEQYPMNDTFKPRKSYPDFDYFNHPHLMTLLPPPGSYPLRRGRNGGWPVYNDPPEQYPMSDPDIPTPPPLPGNRYPKKFLRGRDWQPKITMPEEYFLSNPDIPTPPRPHNNRYRNNLREHANPSNNYYYQ